MSVYKLSVQTYQLTIAVDKPATVRIGRLGLFHFKAGHFIYTGSARRNIIHRVTRHLSHQNRLRPKKIRWHIDYLLNYLQAHQQGRIINVQFSSKTECLLNQAGEGEILIPGFGSSDCHQQCGSHLKYISRDMETAS